MIMGSIAALFVATWQSVLLFLVLTYVTLLIGHSVGMHRMMIHRTFKTPKWVGWLLIYLGTIVGVPMCIAWPPPQLSSNMLAFARNC